MVDSGRFASVEEDEISKIIDGSIPANTKRQTTWDVGAFKDNIGDINQRKLTKYSFVFKTNANQVEYVEMAEQEKTKKHPGGLSDKADKADPKMFSMQAKYIVQFNT